MDTTTRELLKALASAEAEVQRLYDSKDRAMGGHDFNSIGHCLACDAFHEAAQREFRAKEALLRHAAEESARPDDPQSCYPDEIETLHEMLKEQHERLADAEQGIADARATAGHILHKAQAEKRIGALQTAIEALAGAL